MYFHEANRGGHFAAWEEPQLFSEEVRAAFRPPREGFATTTPPVGCRWLGPPRRGPRVGVMATAGCRALMGAAMARLRVAGFTNVSSAAARPPVGSPGGCGRRWGRPAATGSPTHSTRRNRWRREARLTLHQGGQELDFNTPHLLREPFLTLFSLKSFPLKLL
jgi:hypothetical protein